MRPWPPLRLDLSTQPLCTQSLPATRWCPFTLVLSTHAPGWSLGTSSGGKSIQQKSFDMCMFLSYNTLLKSDVTRHDHVVRCHHGCWFTHRQFHSQFHLRWHSLRITLKYTTLVHMRSSNAWTMKSWQRSEWRLGFNSVTMWSWHLDIWLELTSNVLIILSQFAYFTTVKHVDVHVARLQNVVITDTALMNKCMFKRGRGGGGNEAKTKFSQMLWLTGLFRIYTEK